MPRDYVSQPPTAFQRRPHLTKDDDWIRAFLHEAKIGHIATSIDGQPFINPTMFWYDEAERQIVFHSNVAGRVRSNVESNPKVCLEASELGKFLPSNVALEFSLQFRSVVVYGSARLGTIPPRRGVCYMA
ncbi:MAG: pyridoxamine 5'-phosphate oxidase family protein [Anaerolineales bacterium]|nr:MAG: pyridoxamine 5'-phosphate oxidase family protein [Anaerolineales bacterium]